MGLITGFPGLEIVVIGLSKYYNIQLDEYLEQNIVHNHYPGNGGAVMECKAAILERMLPDKEPIN